MWHTVLKCFTGHYKVLEQTPKITYKTLTVGLQQYLERTKDWMIKLFGKYENGGKLYCIAKETKNYLREVNVEDIDETNLERSKIKSQTN